MKHNSLKIALVLTTALFQFASFGQQVKQTKVKLTSEQQQGQIVYKAQVGPDGNKRCATMENDSILRANNPNMPSLYEQEMWLQQRITEFKAEQAANPTKMLPILTIPVVVHVIHNGDAIGVSENISDAQVISQITVLNEDFRRMLGTNGYNTNPVGADVEIEFCLAVVDPNGAPTNGIDRVNYGVAQFASTGAVDAMKPNTIWNPDNYMNMWSVNIGGGLLGYAQFPSNSGLSGLNANGGAAGTDGVVAAFNYFGVTSGGPYNLGRTMTHEVGHYLGLRHIWGDANCGNDFCADTPQSTTSNYGCPNITTCDGNPDMVQNYMDYTDDACMDVFTADQKTRIRTVLTVATRRASLTTSTACQAPFPDNAGISNISGASGNICGTDITPVITLTNYGNNNLTAVDISYDLDGGAPTIINWTGNLAPGGTDVITLPTMTPAAGPHVFNAFTNLPNGNVDADLTNDADLSNFTIVVGGQTITLTINTDCYGEETVWELYDSGANLVEFGGNTTVTLPVTATQGTSAGDPGAYPNETQVTINWCLVADCYDFVLWDAYGDGMYGSQYGTCSTDGNFTITDAGATVLASLQAVNSDFAFSETNNFCVSAPCAATYSSSTTEENCNGDNNGSVTVVFTSGNSTGATFDIGAGPQASGVFTGLAQGTNTITIVDGDGCTTVMQVPLAGPAAFTASANTNNISCNGQTDGQITVSVNGGTGPYTFNIGSGPVGSGIFTGLSANTYTINLVDGNSCTFQVNGTVSEPAVLSATTNTISPELNGNDGSVTLNVVGGTPNFTYSWTDGAGYSSTAANPTNMPGGTYSVTITDVNGCSTTITGIVIASFVGIDELGNTQFIIYPNPSKGVFNVEVKDESNSYSLSVTDVSGRLVYVQNESENNTFIVDLTSSSNGIYMLTIQTENQTITKRIVLKK